MNGAIADPAVSTISAPKASKMIISGNNQNFFLTRRKPQRSLMNSIINFSFLLILLDDKGKQFSSEEFAVQLNKLFNSGKAKKVIVNRRCISL
jgi:23S rRNA pseudoU1915 N3-methylase RlmH